MSATSDRVEAEIEIRPLSYADLPAILEIERASYSTPWRESTFEGLLRRSDSDIVGATRAGVLIGYVVCWTVGDQAELGNVAVDPRERGKGTARRLVDDALDRVRTRGANECFLEVRESNSTARGLYERIGFQAIGRRRNYYTRPVEDAVVMRFDLT